VVVRKNERKVRSQDYIENWEMLSSVDLNTLCIVIEGDCYV